MSQDVVNEGACSAFALCARDANDGILAEAKEEVAKRGNFLFVFTANVVFDGDAWRFNDDIEVAAMAEIICARKSKNTFDFEWFDISNGNGVIW